MTRRALILPALLLGFGLGWAAGIWYAHAAMLPDAYEIYEIYEGYDGDLLAGRVEVVQERLARAARSRTIFRAEQHAHASFGAALTAEAVRQRDEHREQIEAARAAEIPRRSGAPRPYNGDVWARLAQCESSMRNVVSSNGLYYGYFQFLPSTWRSVGGTGLPTDHGYGEQLRRAQILQARSGWGQWPACARRLGLR